MNLIILVTSITIVTTKVVEAKITTSIEVGSDLASTKISYSGEDKAVVGDKEIELFNLTDANLKYGAAQIFGAYPTDVFLKSPTPWGDLYKRYGYFEVTRVLKVKSAKVKDNSAKKSVVLLTHNFDNPSNFTIKVNAGITQTVENRISTTWSEGGENTLSQSVEYGIEVKFFQVSGTTSISHTSTWGKSTEKSDAVTVGVSSGVEVDLRPGQSLTAILSASLCILEVEVEYSITLEGSIAVNYRNRHNGYHFNANTIDLVLRHAKINEEVTVVENIKIGYYTDASLKVVDRPTAKRR